MSLLPTDRLSIALCPAQVGVEYIQAGWRRKEARQTLIDITPQEMDKPIWQGAVDGLARWLGEQTPRRATMTLLLSNYFTRFTLVPWSGSISSPAEEADLALACFESRYGDMAGWTIQFDSVRYGESRIACAVETALIDAARRVFALHNLEWRAVRPAFIAGWNGFLRELNRSMNNEDGIFAMAESNTLVMATHRAGAWHSLRSVAVHVDTQILPQLIEREAVLQGFAKLPSAWVSIPGLISRDIEASTNWNKRLHIVGTTDANGAALTLARWGNHR